MSESPPVEIVFRRRTATGISIDTVQSGIVNRDQGHAHESQFLIAAMAGHVRTKGSDLKEILLAGRFIAMEGLNDSYPRYWRKCPDGIYAITIGPDLIELNWSAIRNEVMTQTIRLLHLNRSAKQIWPDDFASVQDQVSIAVRIADLHRESLTPPVNERH